MAVQRNFATTRMSNIDIWFHAICFCMLVSTGFPPVAAQPGFLSIDCGSSEAYTDNSTGIFWETDAEYVSTGRSSDYGDVADPFDPSFDLTMQLGTLRYFEDKRPKRNRDCYNLPTTPQKRYLIRPTFAIIQNSPFGSGYISAAFDVYLNSTFIRKIETDYFSTQVFYPIEIIFQSTGNDVSLCLVRTGGDSYITSLELRELKSGMYSYAGKSPDGETVFLDKVGSGAFGTNISYYRYPEDAYDRYWWGYNSTTDGIFGNFSEVGNRSNILASTSAAAPDLPPVSVMKNALGSYNNNLSFLANGPAGMSYVTAYFQELDGNASATDVRGMELLVNGQSLGSINSSDQAQELQGPIRNTSTPNLRVTVTQASWSRLPPIINAAEWYTVRTFNTSQTAQDNVDAVSALEKRMPQLLEGKGDPCLPVPFSWLECNADIADPTRYRVTSLLLDNVNISGPIPREIFLFRDLSVLSLSNTNLTGSIPNMANLSLLQILTLSNNKLDGDIQNFGSLVNLQELYLANNAFTGGIPSFFSSFPNLTELHVDNNNFAGVIPGSVDKKMGLSFSYENNPALRLSGPPSGLSNGGVVGIIFGSSAGVAIVSTILWCLLTRKRRAAARYLKEIHDAGTEGSSVSKDSKVSSIYGGNFGSLPVFTLRQISEATQKFSKKVGEGSFGSVFYGKLPNGQEVAVKVKKQASRQGLPEFLNELELLSRIHHRNLLSLVGYCEEEMQQILLYPYMPNGNVGEYLHGTRSKSGAPLSWKTRLNIAVNSATGLEYLHCHCTPRIIHRDVKTANILLDGNMLAKVSDFGISKQALNEMTSGVQTGVKGTFGYLDPELFMSQRLTPHNDVYSFGIVLMEIISGCHPRAKESDDESLPLIEWVRNCARDGNAFDVFDPAMNNKFSYQSARMVLDLALQCTNPSLKRRPDMRQVVRALAQAEQLETVDSSWLGGSDDQAKLDRTYRPGVGLEEVQNEEAYTSGRFSTGGGSSTLNTPSSTLNTRVTHDTTDVEAR